MRMTIITCPFGALPPSGIGAVERVWHQIGEWFGRQGHEVVMVAKDGGEDPLACEGGNLIVVPIKGYERTGSLVWDLMLDFLFSWRALRKVSATDVLVLNTFWSPVLARFFRGRFRRLVYNVQRVPKGQLGMYSEVDLFVTVSQAVAVMIRDESAPAGKKTKVIPNPVDFETFSGCSHKVIERKPSIVLFTGRIHPEKGLAHLVRAAARLHREGSDVIVRLVGPSSIEAGGGGDQYVAGLRDLAGPMPLEIKPPIADRLELASEIASADIYCYPSVAEKGETFGVAPLEAMATGIPVIVSALECFREFAVDGECALVFDHRVDPTRNLSHAIRRLLDDAALRLRLGEEGRKMAERFSVERVGMSYLEHFRELVLD